MKDRSEKKIVPPWALVTPDGHKGEEALSALQKCIRRSREEDALYWMKEVCLAGGSGYVWSRLHVIASEDIGEADPLSALLVSVLHTKAKNKSTANARPDECSDRVFITHAVLHLVRAPKSRIVDNATICAFEGGLAKREIPYFAVDVRTARGKKLGRNEADFWEHSVELTYRANMPDNYESRARELRVIARDGYTNSEYFAQFEEVPTCPPDTE